MPPLRIGKDATVENGPNGAENPVQRVWGPVQVGSAGAGIPACGEPDIHFGEAFEFAPEGDRAPAAEGCPETSHDEPRFGFQRV